MLAEWIRDNFSGFLWFSLSCSQSSPKVIIDAPFKSVQNKQRVLVTLHGRYWQRAEVGQVQAQSGQALGMKEAMQRPQAGQQPCPLPLGLLKVLAFLRLPLPSPGPHGKPSSQSCRVRDACRLQRQLWLQARPSSADVTALQNAEGTHHGCSGSLQTC